MVFGSKRHYLKLGGLFGVRRSDFRQIVEKIGKRTGFRRNIQKRRFMDIQEEIKQRGVLEGRKQGMQQGREEERRQVILNMLQNKLDIALITKVTGLPEAEIIKLKNGS